MSAFHTLNLRGNTSTTKDQNSLSIRVSARQKNKAQMWERLTSNFLKKLSVRIPMNQHYSSRKLRLQQLIGSEVSQFLEISTLTDKSLRELEARLEYLLQQEQIIGKNQDDDIRQSLHISPSKKSLKDDFNSDDLEIANQYDANNDSVLPEINMSKVQSDYLIQQIHTKQRKESRL